ncbi:helix-turn-helix domain-containing protein [Chitinophaga sp. CF418]|uniref:helix-turn-helix domain-containing protein n=1 Tax=Chitinophaga sp. CF418 TaxID=1855287 RepID=UPI000912BE25|nr:helix-turn-helix domain-containing protein [Chitinophaga sp. CF418]SHN38671.1 AraC-type DNA-binding protein [Chitinophaga sp. CF418]
MIPVFSIDEVADGGFFIGRYVESETVRLIDKVVHRDDHYIFIIQEQGKSVVTIDFREVSLSGAALGCILPGQVHGAISAESTVAWFIAIKAEFISEAHRNALGVQVPLLPMVSLEPSMAAMLQETLLLLLKARALYKGGDLNASILHSLIHAALGMIAQGYESQERSAKAGMSRSAAISSSFRSLVSKNYRDNKAPSDYAKMLNISYTYLYEVIKEHTGFPPIYWIQLEVTTEAKRLLFFTDLSIKEISCLLGFEDHNYFSRFFTKLSGAAPLHFRRASRE